MTVTSAFEDRSTSAFGWPRHVLVIDVPDLCFETLAAAARHLCSRVPDVGEAVAADPFRIFPVRLRAGHTEFSERAFWRLLAEGSDEAVALVSRYITALHQVNLAFHNEDDAACGANAVFGALDVLVLDTVETHWKADEALLDAFLTYICELADLSHEVHEHRYIQAVLQRTRGTHRDHYARLLFHRLMFGQRALSEMGFDDLYRLIGPTPLPSRAHLADLLREAVRREADVGDAGTALRSVLTAVYGSAEEAIRDAYAWMAPAFAGQETPPLTEREQRGNRYLAICSDARRQLCQRSSYTFSTGLHDYDAASGTWVRCAGQTWPPGEGDV